MVSPREDGPGGQEPDPGAFRYRVTDCPEKKSKKLSELKKKEVLL